MEVTVSKVDRIWNRTEAMLNQHTFDAAIDAACVRYTCDEVFHILDLSEDVLRTVCRFDPSHHALGCHSVNREVWEIAMASRHDGDGQKGRSPSIRR